jgi:hypothetical protein
VSDWKPPLPAAIAVDDQSIALDSAATGTAGSHTADAELAL